MIDIKIRYMVKKKENVKRRGYLLQISDEGSFVRDTCWVRHRIKPDTNGVWPRLLVTIAGWSSVTYTTDVLPVYRLVSNGIKEGRRC